MLEFKEWFLESTEWLYTIIWQSDFFFIDFWSFPHFWSGCFLFLIFTAKNIRRKWLIILAILFTYEIFEIIIKYFVFNIFKPETFPDQITDFVLGIIGAICTYYLISCTINIDKKNTKNKIEFFITALITALTISFLWVGFYDYTYGYDPNIFERFNYATFGVFLLLIFSALSLFNYSIHKFDKEITAFITSYLFSLILLFIIELVTHKIFSLNLITRISDKPLFFGLLKGDTTLKVFYLTAGILSIGLYKYFCSLYRSAEKNIKSNNILLN